MKRHVFIFLFTDYAFGVKTLKIFSYVFFSKFYIFPLSIGAILSWFLYKMWDLSPLFSFFDLKMSHCSSNKATLILLNWFCTFVTSHLGIFVWADFCSIALWADPSTDTMISPWLGYIVRPHIRQVIPFIILSVRIELF